MSKTFTFPTGGVSFPKKDHKIIRVDQHRPKTSSKRSPNPIADGLWLTTEGQLGVNFFEGLPQVRLNVERGEDVTQGQFSGRIRKLYWNYSSVVSSPVNSAMDIIRGVNKINDLTCPVIVCQRRNWVGILSQPDVVHVSCGILTQVRVVPHEWISYPCWKNSDCFTMFCMVVV